MKLSVIVPALNEASGIVEHLQHMQWLRARGHELILVDGGSTDATALLAKPLVDVVLNAPRGRAHQMNAGVRRSSGEGLVFLHADTELPVNADQLIREALSVSRVAWGRFAVAIDGGHFMLPIVSMMMNWRSRWTGIATGDQAMFMTRELYNLVGGFPQLALMEDVAMSARLKREAAPVCLRQKVLTSGRRWLKHGVFKTIFSMWHLRLRFALGVPAQRLAQDYSSHDL